jgi:hypothetical protein
LVQIEFGGSTQGLFNGFLQWCAVGQAVDKHYRALVDGEHLDLKACAQHQRTLGIPPAR